MAGIAEFLIKTPKASDNQIASARDDREEAVVYYEPVPWMLFDEADAVQARLIRSLSRWQYVRVRGRWFINSHPKSGTHLLRNVLMHFNGPLFDEEMIFFDSFSRKVIGESGPRIYSGHVPYNTFSTNSSSRQNPRLILLIRHPCAIAVALARAFYDVNTSREDHIEMRARESFADIVRAVVCGYECAGKAFDPLEHSLDQFAIQWLGHADFTFKYEDIVARLGGTDAELLAYFAPLLNNIYEPVPSNAASRIRAGAEGSISATYSRTNPGMYEIPEPGQVYDLLPGAVAARLRAAAKSLGY